MIRGSSAPSRRSSRPPIPVASAMARFSSAPSTRRFASAPERKARTRSKGKYTCNTAQRRRPAAKGTSPTTGKEAMSDIQKVMNMIKEHDVKYVDFRFTDPRGKWQHLAHHIRTITEDFLAEGVMFDGSSIAGWKAINESDMLLKPDCATAVLDPFAAQTSLIIFCDTHEPGTGQPYARDPRSIAKKAERYLASTGVGDKAFFGPEAEFFVFDDVRYKSGMNGAMYEIDAEEGPWVSDKKFPDGNTGHRPPIKGGYFPVPPVDGASDLRAEMLSTMAEMGLDVEKHHHEVAPSQHELGAE